MDFMQKLAGEDAGKETCWRLANGAAGKEISWRLANYVILFRDTSLQLPYQETKFVLNIPVIDIPVSSSLFPGFLVSRGVMVVFY
jgi:hypothetical protein